MTKLIANLCGFSENRWIIKTTRGDVIKAKFVATAGGPLHKPKLPGVTGIEKFKGHSFHTSRWDYEYTGGSSKGDLTGLRDKRVGVIGTGATAVQVVILPQSSHLQPIVIANFLNAYSYLILRKTRSTYTFFSALHQL